ncbi:superoxide dismutase family protein [Pseudothauera nasutitermitis]|uniref:Superoxide dismutase family protein n=1 Tax=Pseudothauera nasutitermitis TaxID=2565930 RepID=A0A4S4B457_9RHOO|nr:superoxide dismutase family protein [Pseudothauera nasutitermitis]THF67429.1 superoxide dismutase family protein [Pseudothauera nasutitermitis]
MNTRQRLLAAALIAASVTAAHAAERATAELVDRQGNAIGTATLVDGPHGLLIHVSAKGLPAGPKGIHIHGIGTCADNDKGFTASGAHVNPAGKKHGLLNPEGPDAGDLPNIFAHADGSVEAELFTPLASLSGTDGRATLLDADGAALVIHENRDDHVSQPIGGAGARIACGVLKATP